MLGRYAQIGHVGDVHTELADRLQNDRQARFDILGEDSTRSVESLRRDWRGIPREQREAAKAAYQQRPEAHRRRELAQRRSATLTP